MACLLLREKGKHLRFRDDKVHAWVLSRCVPVRPRSAPIKRGVPYAAGVAGRTLRLPFAFFNFYSSRKKRCNREKVDNRHFFDFNIKYFEFFEKNISMNIASLS